MINIFYSPGNYGSYLAQSIFSYSNLGFPKPVKFDNKTGHSHGFRDSNSALQHFNFFYEPIAQNNFYKTVVILPQMNRCLDYCNNLLIKQYKNNVFLYLSKLENIKSIQTSFKANWAYNNNIEQTPRWIVREWLSMYLEQYWTSAFDLQKFEKISGDFYITTDDLFNDFEQKIFACMQACGLNILDTKNNINLNHKQWLKLQKYHNSQTTCTQYIMDLLSNKFCASPALTLFDEAYMQMLLRQHNYEIACDGLDIFPENSEKLWNICIKI